MDCVARGVKVVKVYDMIMIVIVIIYFFGCFVCGSDESVEEENHNMALGGSK